VTVELEYLDLMKQKKSSFFLDKRFFPKLFKQQQMRGLDKNDEPQIRAQC